MAPHKERRARTRPIRGDQRTESLVDLSGRPRPRVAIADLKPNAAGEWLPSVRRLAGLEDELVGVSSS